ncbi:MAG: hypothetical protein M3463_19895, partial [Verrucomicrobiota bacterium]|nr:hypothetical protein [Verrucomicrobiota bacterium]
MIEEKPADMQQMLERLRGGEERFSVLQRLGGTFASRDAAFVSNIADQLPPPQRSTFLSAASAKLTDAGDFERAASTLNGI